jgi:tRNA(fMet)-specific endonuclease VapC
MFLLDTDILIYSLKGQALVVANVTRHREDRMAMSVISLMELYYGARKSQRMEANLAKVRALSASFGVIPLGEDCAETFGELKAGLAAKGTPLDDFDLAIAATALVRNLTLVTNNEAHFRRISGLKVQNWARG